MMVIDAFFLCNNSCNCQILNPSLLILDCFEPRQFQFFALIRMHACMHIVPYVLEASSNGHFHEQRSYVDYWRYL